MIKCECKCPDLKYVQGNLFQYRPINNAKCRTEEKNVCRYYFVHHQAALSDRLIVDEGAFVQQVAAVRCKCVGVFTDRCVYSTDTQKTHMEIHFSLKTQLHRVLCLVFSLTSKAINVSVLKRRKNLQCALQTPEIPKVSELD